MDQVQEVIRIMLVDDHDMVRRGLAAFLSVKPDLELVGEANTGAEAITVCEKTRPHVILMDLLMPEMGGAEATRIIRERWPHIQVIALTSFQEKKLIKEVLQAGAIGFLLKNVSVDELATAIRAARSGQSTLSPEAMSTLLQPATETEETAAEEYDLTPREQDVLELLVQGLSNPDIAERLSVSRSTARAHVSHILAKLGVTNRGEAIAYAIRHKLVS